MGTNGIPADINRLYRSTRISASAKEIPKDCKSKGPLTRGVVCALVVSAVVPQSDDVKLSEGGVAFAFSGQIWLNTSMVRGLDNDCDLSVETLETGGDG
jgi:hypothetical protein